MIREESTEAETLEGQEEKVCKNVIPHFNG